MLKFPQCKDGSKPGINDLVYLTERSSIWVAIDRQSIKQVQIIDTPARG